MGGEHAERIGGVGDSVSVNLSDFLAFRQPFVCARGVGVADENIRLVALFSVVGDGANHFPVNLGERGHFLFCEDVAAHSPDVVG